MLPRVENDIFGRRDGKARFGAGEAREILDRAAAEQCRLERKLDGSYTRKELADMAAEAGISAEALNRAIESAQGPLERRLRRLPGNASAAVKGTVIAALAIAVIVGLPLLFPDVAYALVFATVLALLVAVLVGV